MKTKKNNEKKKKFQQYESSCVTVIFWTGLWKGATFSLGCSYLVHFGAASHVCRLHDESISSIEWVLELEKKKLKERKQTLQKER